MQQDKINIDLKLPTKWEDLTDKHLRYVFALLAQGFTATEVKAYCLCRWAGLKVLHRYGKVWACKHDGLQFRSPRNSGCASAILNKFRLRSTCTEFVLAAEQVERATHALDWLDSVPALPVRLAKIGSHGAIDAQFQGVPFETFIVCDNLYQGYLATKQDELLDEMASHLYTRKCSDEGVVCSDLLRGLFPPYTLHLTQTERISVFYWFASIKTFFARVFKHFFQPVSNASGDDGNMFEQQQSQYEQLQNAFNAQIRALTKGDVTKEQQVLSLDTWRALTELDAQAREYEEISRKYPRGV